MHPYRMYFVVAVEFCERFSFSSLRSILSFYIRDVLLYNEGQAIDIYHVFLMLCYVSAIIGGIVANTDYGKYKSILSSSIVYWIGVLLLFWTTVQEKNTSQSFVVLYSLILVSIGTGCVKSCIATFGVDQLIGNDQNINSTNVRVFFSTFYFAIHLGIFFGLLASPTIAKIMLYEGHKINMYTVTFGLPVIMITIAIGVFVCGYPYYSFRKPMPNVIPKMIKCIFFISLKQLTSYYKKPKRKQQSLTDDSFSEDFINDTIKTLHMLRLYVPLSIFWSLFDQQNTTWMFQAAYTSDRMFGIKFPVCLLQVVNPLLVLFTIPLMDHIVYPYLDKHKLFKHPLKRMLLGGSIAGISFIFAGCIELYLEKYPQSVNVTNVNLCAYANPSPMCLWSSNSGVQKLNHNQYFIVNDIGKTVRENSPEIQIVTCDDSKRNSMNDEKTIIKTRLKRNKMSIVLLLVVMGTENDSFNDYTSLINSSTVLIPENTTRTSPEGSIYIIFPENNGDNWLQQIENLTLQSASIEKTTVYEKNRFQKPRISDIPLGLYTLTINYMNENRRPKSRIVLNVETDKIYTYTRSYRNETNSTFQSNTVSQSHVMSKEWLLPQFVLMAFGETLFTMTGLAFSFSEAPETIKTLSISMWYFSVALGNLIVIIVNKILVFEKKSNMFFTFALNSFLTIVVTYKLSDDFERLYVEKESSDTENVDLVILLKKESYQLAF